MTPIDYPNDLLDIALLGKPGAWLRQWLLRPLRGGRYSLFVWPSNLLELRALRRQDLVFRDGGGAPQSVVLEVPRPLRVFRDWRWRLVRWPSTWRPSRPEPGQGVKTDAGSGDNAQDARSLQDERTPPASGLLFDEHPTLEGTFSIADDHGDEPHRIVMWSCHQPYVTDESGRAALHADQAGLLEWAQDRIEGFGPHIVWGLGDTAYADGTPATDFVRQVYGQVDLQGRPGLRAELRSAYRHMYRAHWSFRPLQSVMGNVPHLCVWDDHEIRDGWGSEEQDFAGGNPLVFEVAREVADEYILNHGPRVRRASMSTPPLARPDAHQAYVSGAVAAFIFDGRSSRRYADSDGRVLSEQQFVDFEAFCAGVAEDRNVRFLVMGCAVPFINLKDVVEELGAKAPKALTDLMAGIRDDIRDSWHAPSNREGLKRLIGILRRLHRRRADIDIVNISGDFHVANAFSFQPPGFFKALYQFTSSALTNREHPPEALAALVDLGSRSFSEVLGLVTRIWDSIGEPNLMTLEPRGEVLRVTLRVYDLDLPPSERAVSPGRKDLVFDIGNETFGLRRMLAA